jgi:peptide/nickel transport system substrate-binding protein
VRSRKFAPAAAVLMVLSFVIGAPGARNVIASGAHQAGGTLTVAYEQPPDTLNPATTGETSTWVMIRNIFDSLTYLDQNGKVTPWLASSWKLTHGGKSYIFTIRKGVKFHDGTPLDAAAVAYNIKYLENPGTHSLSVSELGPYKGVKVLSKYQVEYDLKAAFAPLLVYLSLPGLGIQSPAAIKKYGKQVGNHPVGTGPFMFDSYVRPTKLTFVKNPKYQWAPPAMGHNGPAALDKIVYDFSPTGAVRMQALQTGQAQLIDRAPELFYKTLKSNPAYKPLPVLVDGSGVVSIINNQKFPTNDPAVRKAISYAIDKVGVIKLADAGQYPPTWGPLQKGTIGYDTEFNGMYSYNPSKAAKILTADGWKKVNGTWTKGGKQLSLLINSIGGAGDFTTLATAQTSYLTKFGIKVDLRAPAVSAWYAANTSGAFNLTGPLQFSYPDPDVLRIMYGKGQPFNWTKLQSRKMNQLFAKADTVPLAQRIKLYAQAQRIIMNTAAMLPVRLNENLDLMSTKLKGVIVTKGGFIDYYLAHF